MPTGCEANRTNTKPPPPLRRITIEKARPITTSIDIDDDIRS
jgi:hypothetical protein